MQLAAGGVVERRGLTDMRQNFLRFFTAHMREHREKFIAAIASDEILLRDGGAQDAGEVRDQRIAGKVAKRVVDRFQAVQVEHHHRGLEQRLLAVHQQFLTAALVGQSGVQIGIRLAVQLTVAAAQQHFVYGLLNQQQDERAHNDRQHDLQIADVGRCILRIILCCRYGAVRQLEIGFAHVNDLGLLVTLFAYLVDLLLELLPVIVLAFQFVLIIQVADAGQLVFAAAVQQTIKNGVEIVDHLVVRLLGDFQLDNSLSCAAQDTCVVDDAGIALNIVHLCHHQHGKHDH